MSYRKLIKQLESKIEQELNITPTKIEFEGPTLVVYTQHYKEVDINSIKSLAKQLKKRIQVRADPKSLMDADKARALIQSILPPEAGLEEIHFNRDSSEVILELQNPGAVLSMGASKLKQIFHSTGWAPEVLRVPSIRSSIVSQIRSFLRHVELERREFLIRTGQRIVTSSSHKDRWIRLSFLGGCREVGRSCYLISTPQSKVMIDCGIGMAGNGFPYLYVPELAPISELDAVIVTHAHLDHSGLVPLLFMYGYDGPIYTTQPTRDLMALLWLDYLEIASQSCERPPYTHEQVRDAIKHCIPLGYDEVTDIAPDLKLTFQNAGHILGSSIVHLHLGEGLHNVVFSGDFKFERTFLFEPASYDFQRVETLVIESTYGGRSDYQPSRKDAEMMLQELVNKIIPHGGKLLIPAFSVGRSQEVMLVLEDSMSSGAIQQIPVYLDGMVWEATAIHTAYPEFLGSELRSMIYQQKNPFLSENFIWVNSPSKREEAMEARGCVIITTSGMLNGGPVLEYLKALGGDPRNCLVFVGYQAEGTLGRKIQRGLRDIDLGSHQLKLQMQIATVDGFSGHSDRRQLLGFIQRLSSKTKPKLAIVTHGEESKCLDLCYALRNKFGIEAIAPRNLETIRLA